MQIQDLLHFHLNMAQPMLMLGQYVGSDILFKIKIFCYHNTIGFRPINRFL